MKPTELHKKKVDSEFLKGRIRDMSEGLVEAIDREVARRRREGLPIHVWQDGKVVDLQQQQESDDD